MNYYKWLDSDDIDGVTPWVLRTLHLYGVEKWDLNSGLWVENWYPQNSAEYELDGYRDDFVSTAFYVPVFSPKLKELTEKLSPGEIQYLPLQIRRIGGGGEVNGYHIANILKIVDSMDRKLSDYLEWKPGDHREDLIGKSFRDVGKAVLRRSSIGDVKIFREKMWDIMIVVREDIKLAIEKAGLTGSKFRKLETIP